ncbi:UNVERIFIED_ORG: uncharacterized membrane protein YhaH (DUF805 family) [Rhizobium aethiopicum]|uniref:DUF805 domain-containing protein n=1 Tax=unclassified Rhizobium TaxID=2613769 RepID=UPI0008D980BF|nr:MULTISPECIES: DUF805 domain-containing protein [unclassified Rhizobium]OHV24234.1 hypothetical protein BBJ66_25720 [Rhizobium sp. RSm-3]RVU07448.1 DUF805 domain-containing protein [Rhizobium sp. RMa-01]
MGLTEAVRTIFKQKYATFFGRASRAEYWWFMLFLALLLFVLVILAGGLVVSGTATPVEALAVIGGLFILAIFLPLTSLQVRRFHDRNISGWWYLALCIGSLIPYVGTIAGIAILVISVLKGTEGPNKFGPDPLRPEARAEVFA